MDRFGNTGKHAEKNPADRRPRSDLDSGIQEAIYLRLEKLPEAARLGDDPILKRYVQRNFFDIR